MVKCRRKRKYGGGLVWDKMKRGVGKWGEAGKAGMANVKAAQERAKIEGEVLANSYKNQKSSNSVSAMPTMPAAMPAAMPATMPTMAATGGKRRRRRRRRTKKRKFKKHNMWNTNGKRYVAKTYKQHIRGIKLGHTHKKPKRRRKSRRKRSRRRRR